MSSTQGGREDDFMIRGFRSDLNVFKNGFRGDSTYGVVINDSLILMARISKSLQKNVSIYKAVMRAGKAHFRAIFLTAITTFLSLLPLINEQSSDAEKIMPMAITLAFGILFSTVITLLLVTISCVILKEVSSKHSNQNPSIG